VVITFTTCIPLYISFSFLYFFSDSAVNDVVFTDVECARHKENISTGVCDYTKPDVGKPQKVERGA